ncbi:hypothetical protein STENM327S_02579 [Streptomyces tendae]
MNPAPPVIRRRTARTRPPGSRCRGRQVRALAEQRPLHRVGEQRLHRVVDEPGGELDAHHGGQHTDGERVLGAGAGRVGAEDGAEQVVTRLGPSRRDQCADEAAHVLTASASRRVTASGWGHSTASSATARSAQARAETALLGLRDPEQGGGGLDGHRTGVVRHEVERGAQSVGPLAVQPFGTRPVPVRRRVAQHRRRGPPPTGVVGTRGVQEGPVQRGDVAQQGIAPGVREDVPLRTRQIGVAQTQPGIGQHLGGHRVPAGDEGSRGAAPQRRLGLPYAPGQRQRGSRSPRAASGRTGRRWCRRSRRNARAVSRWRPSSLSVCGPPRGWWSRRSPCVSRRAPSVPVQVRDRPPSTASTAPVA